MRKYFALLIAILLLFSLLVNITAFSDSNMASNMKKGHVSVDAIIKGYYAVDIALVKSPKGVFIYVMDVGNVSVFDRSGNLIAKLTPNDIGDEVLGFVAIEGKYVDGVGIILIVLYHNLTDTPTDRSKWHNTLGMWILDDSNNFSSGPVWTTDLQRYSFYTGGASGVMALPDLLRLEENKVVIAPPPYWYSSDYSKVYVIRDILSKEGSVVPDIVVDVSRAMFLQPPCRIYGDVLVVPVYDLFKGGVTLNLYNISGSSGVITNPIQRVFLGTDTYIFGNPVGGAGNVISVWIPDSATGKIINYYYSGSEVICNLSLDLLKELNLSDQAILFGAESSHVRNAGEGFVSYYSVIAADQLGNASFIVLKSQCGEANSIEYRILNISGLLPNLSGESFQLTRYAVPDKVNEPFMIFMGQEGETRPERNITGGLILMVNLEKNYYYYYYGEHDAYEFYRLTDDANVLVTASINPNTTVVYSLSPPLFVGGEVETTHRSYFLPYLLAAVVVTSVVIAVKSSRTKK